MRLSLALLLSLSRCSASTPAAPAATDAGGFSVAGDPDEGLGIFDPSVVYPVGADAGAIVYSAVAPDQLHVHTRIAASTDQGRTWQFASEVNQAVAATVSTSDSTVCGQSSCSGMIIHEVASLLIDPGDSPDRLFKIFTHTYFAVSAAALHPEIGVLTLYTSASAAGPWSETPLIGWTGSSPYSTAGVAQNASADPALGGVHKCVALTEPGALLRGNTIDLAVGCAFPSNGQPQIEIDLLRSTDHARSFSFVSTLLQASDAAALGGTNSQLNAPDLFQIAGQTFLFATPGGVVQFPGGTGAGYRGCVSIAVTDLDAGVVARSGGAPVITSSYLGQSQQFIGACTAAEGAPALGVAGDLLSLTQPLFTIFSTGKPAP